MILGATVGALAGLAMCTFIHRYMGLRYREIFGNPILYVGIVGMTSMGAIVGRMFSIH